MLNHKILCEASNMGTLLLNKYIAAINLSIVVTFPLVCPRGLYTLPMAMGHDTVLSWIFQRQQKEQTNN